MSAVLEAKEPSIQSPVSEKQTPVVFVGLPHYGDVAAQAIEGMLLATTTDVRWRIDPGWCSILPHNFNSLLCKCLNSRHTHHWTHFGLHHADIEAAPGWLDTLLEEMDKHNADVISTIVPIKDSRGLTSTGWMEPSTGEVTRLTMTEAMKLPQTFDVSLMWPGKWLMINTGLWICRLGPWIEEFTGFEFQSCVKKHPDGKFRPHVLPEDWAFSEWCARKGLRVYATRAVKVSHHGRTQFLNDSAWGDWETDKGDQYVEQNGSDKPDPAEKIHGWCSRQELKWLREQAAKAKVIVEVGSWHGRSTYALAESSPADALVIAIDHFQGSPGDIASELANAKESGPKAREAFKENLKPFLESGKVVLIDKPSKEGLVYLIYYKNKPDLMFIDGAHDYQHVYQDIAMSQNFLAPGGVLCGHDIDREGVRRAVDELCPGWKHGPGSIWIA